MAGGGCGIVAAGDRREEVEMGIRLGRTIATLASAGALASAAPAAADTPVPEGGFAPVQVAREPCQDRTYPECRRLRFTYGPIVVTPGNNAQLVGPVTIEKPAEDGYMTRFRPDLVRADGVAPPVDEVHLHHATWLSVLRHGSTHPFIAAGEEKTIAEPRPPYGYLVGATDTWQLNYMLHNATPRAETLWIVYDVDFTPKAAAERRGVIPTVPLWLDVMLDSDRPTYPVFNTQLGFGSRDPRTGRRECAFPRETCADFDPFGKPQPGNGRGWDRPVTPDVAGTVVGAAGHVHPGGLRTELSVARGDGAGERARRIFDSDALYWDPNGPVSWDMSMTTAKPGWKVQIRPGDRLRMNAVYETERASWYEGMGIMMLWVAPGDRSGVDPFATERVRERRRVRVRARVRVRRRVAMRGGGRARRVWRTSRGWRTRHVWRERWVTRPAPIDTKGRVTHGHLAEASHHGGGSSRPLRAPDGAQTTDIGIGNFRYSAGDLSTLDRDGIPLVRYGGRLSFYNFDAAAGIWHTITTCRPPCNGTVGISYPLADDGSRLDSLELGFAPSWGLGQPAANRGDYTIEPAKVKLQPGTVATYYCRVHPFMRGAFKVVR
jgi:hypothetical protein